MRDLQGTRWLFFWAGPSGFQPGVSQGYLEVEEVAISEVEEAVAIAALVVEMVVVVV